ncbi:MAG: glycosyltransferase family 4 protein [Opitutaceae bacterium]|nr:glycosyltransferase family 4 protein [Opitutaceae bacterium]
MNAPTPPPPALLLNGLPLGISHGIRVYTRRLLEALAHRHPEIPVRILLTEDRLDLAAGLPEASIVTVPGRSPFSRPFLADFWRQDRIVRHAARHHGGATFVSTHEVWSRARPPRSVVVIHDAIYERYPQFCSHSYFPRRFVRQLCLRWSRRATRVLTTSHDAARDLVGLAGLPPGLLRVVNPWIDRRFETRPSPAQVAALRARLGLPEKYLLYLSGFRLNKNVEFLLRTYAAGAALHGWPPLVVAGALPAHPRRVLCTDVPAILKQVCPPPGRVLLPGHIADADLTALYAGASLFVFPSLLEGFGYTPIEAGAMGASVIAARAASLPEVLGPRIACFDPDRPDQLTAAINEALRDPDRFRLPLDSAFTEEAGIERWLAAATDHAPPPA